MKCINYLTLAILLFLYGCGSDNMVNTIESALKPMTKFKYNFTYSNEMTLMFGKATFDLFSETAEIQAINSKTGKIVNIKIHNKTININDQMINYDGSFVDSLRQTVTTLGRDIEWAKPALSFPLSMADKQNENNFVTRYSLNDLSFGNYNLKEGPMELTRRFYDSLDSKGTGFDKNKGGYIDYAGIELAVAGKNLSKIWIYGIYIEK